MNERLRKIKRRIKRFMDEKVATCKEVLSSAQNRLVLGLVATGIGLSLIASAYIRVPA